MFDIKTTIAHISGNRRENIKTFKHVNPFQTEILDNE